MEEKDRRDNAGEELYGEFVVQDEDGNDVTLYIVDMTKINGTDYILATDTQEDGGAGLIFKMTPLEDSDEVLLDNVSEDEYEYISKVFAETAEVNFEI
ncbi:MAG: DUF1292 domain-containing protein [Lachnospiraceae bacterium]|nr:DUF1292 domain-containing protein [Lachnospiraceae bacterium]